MTPELVVHLIFNFNSHVQIILQKGPNIPKNLQNYVTFHLQHLRHMFEDVVDAGDHLLTMPCLSDRPKLQQNKVIPPVF